MRRKSTVLSETLQIVTITHHQGGTVFAWKGNSYRPMEELRQPMTDLIERVQKEAELQGGLVGHIKAYVTDSGCSASFSGTGEEVAITIGKPRETSVYFTAILFDCREKQMAALITELVSAL